jgi:hypothetical protein
MKNNYPLRIKITGNVKDRYVVKRWHSYWCDDPILMILILMDEYSQYEAVINGIRFEGATEKSVKVALKLFFKKHKILEKLNT